MLSIEVCLANAGFNAKDWQMYHLPRSRGTSLQDADVKQLVEFFFPDLYNLVRRATLGYHGKPEGGDVSSVTNFRFLCNLQEMTFFWIQDAVILLGRDDLKDDLKDEPPWSWMLANEEARKLLESIASRIGDAVENADLTAHRNLLAQQELVASVRAGSRQAANDLDVRLASLPANLHTAVQNHWSSHGREELVQTVSQHVAMTLQGTFRNMFYYGMNGGNPPASEGACSVSGEQQYSPGRSTHTSEEEGGVGAYDDEAVEGAGGEEAAPEADISGRACTSGGADTSGGAQARGGAHAVAAGRTHRPRMPHIWAAPLPTRIDPVVTHNKAPGARAAPPEKGALVTGPREDGWFLGNDRDSITGVWQLHLEILQWIESHPERAQNWWVVNCLSKEERKSQERMRHRRRAVWDAIKGAARAAQREESEVVSELQQLQTELACGISRIEALCADMKKGVALSDIPEGTTGTILDYARNYAKKATSRPKPARPSV